MLCLCLCQLITLDSMFDYKWKLNITGKNFVNINVLWYLVNILTLQRTDH